MYRAVRALAVAIIFSAGALLSAAPVAYAYDSDVAIEQYSALCTRQVSRQERRYGIPFHLLGAIANSESGRWHQGLSMAVPWPWTANVEGASYFFHTKAEAVSAVQKFQAQGKRSIDVGCMQVNLMHHPEAFSSLSQAFDPGYNVDYAARFLRGHYDETHSWRAAVGRYHSRTPYYAESYIGRVYNAWHQLTARISGQRNPHRYSSYVKVEHSGQQVTFDATPALVSHDAPEAPAEQNLPNDTNADRRVIKVATADTSHGRYDLTIIRPTESAGKIESIPAPEVMDATEASNGPLVVSNGNVRNLNEPAARVLRMEEGETEDTRFVRFSN